MEGRSFEIARFEVKITNKNDFVKFFVLNEDLN